MAVIRFCVTTPALHVYGAVFWLIFVSAIVSKHLRTQRCTVCSAQVDRRFLLHELYGDTRASTPEIQAEAARVTAYRGDQSLLQGRLLYVDRQVRAGGYDPFDLSGGSVRLCGEIVHYPGLQAR